MQATITKEEVKLLPLEHFSGSIIIIDDLNQVQAAVDNLRQAKVIGFDTETRPSFKQGETHKVALLQLATTDTCYLFRLSVIGLPLPLVQLLQDPAVKKIALSSQDDFLALKRRHPLRPEGFIELQHMVKNYGIQELSLQKIYAILFSKHISKTQRLSNWEASSLTAAQRSYAAIDAWATLRIYLHLTSSDANNTSLVS
ncbi:MAG: 3'-5' exonuclease domain-containing protein 2 [Paludibacteraceae bacterium]|nr:3'-5' exonuclease domain-containing protein 2 [Paludibacteraceae bacterium]